MGVRKRPQIGHVGTTGPEMENLEVSQPDHGGQGQVAVPQVSPLGHGSEIEFKVSKPHQGGQVPPAIAACYHYLLLLRAWVLSRSRHIYLIVTPSHDAVRALRGRCGTRHVGLSV